MQEPGPLAALDADPRARLFQALLESAPDAMVIVDAEGAIVLVNSQAERLFQYPRGELLSKRVEDLVPPRFRHSHADHRVDYIANAQPRPMGAGLELYGVRRDGTEFPVEISLSPIDTEFGRLVASAIRDITDRRQAEMERERLVRERAAQVAADRLKDEFLATLSHELRTPLNVLIGEVWRLRSATLPPDRAARSWHAVERNLALLRRLVEDLLDVSRGITGKLTLDLTPTDLASVVDDALDVVKPTAAAKGVEVVQHVSTVQSVVMGDAARLQQVFWNLLSNAVKFTPRGGRIEVEVSRVETSVQVAVTDSGIGIAPEFLPHVFERFAQADSSVTRTYSGLGLGLAIVQQLIEQHGGSVHAYSTGANKGARFEVRLPVPAVLPHAVSARPLSAHLPRLDGVRVLLVDDQADAREAIAAVLAHFGADLRTAASADEALAVFAEFHPDVLLADIAMPARDGYELIRAIRQQAEGAHVPAVALTAYAAPEDRVRAVSAGFQLHVAKPVQPLELAATVAHLFHSHRGPAAHHRAHPLAPDRT